MTRFLITGGAGFIGSSLAHKLASNNRNDVTIVDNLSTGRKEHIPKGPNVRFANLDVNSLKSIKPLLNEKFDYIYHYAAVVGVHRTLTNPIKVLNDIEGIKNILELSRRADVKRVFFSSSSEVYGEPVHMPQHEETTPLNSRLPYAVVKNIGECFLGSYNFEYGLNYTIFRFFNTYGPHQSEDFVMSKFLEAALHNSDITIYGKGDQTRTFCYIADNVEATINAINDKTVVNKVVNIGSDQEITINDLANRIIKLTGSKSKVVHLPPLKEGDMTRRKPDITKMRRLLKRPLTNLEIGVNFLIDYKKEQA